ncbi:hypothetical protein ACH474_15120 [Nocardia rhamnosiphila]|uniref:IrrE N-terminal-like domain-containing protein n=1 Tax=Nocardia rhamnosiphila TaxID=426716 RepID=A0ABV2WX44_9NOCA|nr:hypothetical protein [Nocardia rhamnosiphila]
MTSMDARFGDAAGSVPLPSPWDLNAYLADVAAHRKRPISLQPAHRSALADLGCNGNGLWIARKNDDIIVYDASASGRNADHIVLHAVGHMLLGHGGPGAEDPDTTRISLGALNASLLDALATIAPGSITQILGRDDFGPDREREAGVFAEMTMVYAALPRRRTRSFWPFGRRRNK